MLYAICVGAMAFSAPLSPFSRATQRSAVAMKWGESLDALSIGTPGAKPTALQKDHGKLVITLATTGNINTKERNPSLPCSPQEMADDMHECIKLGVSVLHIHARNEENKPTMRVDKFRETVRLVKERDPGSAMPLEASQRLRCEDACARWAERVSEGC